MSKSERSREDAAAPMGTGCVRVIERVMASLGKLGSASPKFKKICDVPNGGVLWALPALLSNGLLRHSEKCFSLPKGFYGLVHVFVLLAYMALMRVRSVEQLRYRPPGETGKLLGLDRIPEVRTLRIKLKTLAETGQVKKWGRALSREWMAEAPESAGVMYADGHVRVYHGSQTRLPRRYVARERLCLRGMTDYWINDRAGRPYFVTRSAFTHGLLRMLRQEIVPRLLEDVPGQPDEEALEADPHLHRFTLVFDREGYSPAFFKEMKDKRVACQTYRKYQGEDWPEEEFRECIERLTRGGEPVKMKIAERGVCLGKIVWVREFRKLTASGHQTSVISTDYCTRPSLICVHMFARWCQENFFRYMRQHFALDRLVDYSTAPVDETEKVVNPAWRKLDCAIRKKAGRLGRKKVEFAEIALEKEIGDKEVANYEKRRGTLFEEINAMQQELAGLKDQRRKAGKHIPLSALPVQERFEQLAPAGKDIVDTIKMIAYRAETALAAILRDSLARADDARSLARELFMTEADLEPDEKARTLTVRLHMLSNPLSNKAAQRLAETLNQTDTCYPGTNMRLVYEMVSSSNP